MVVCIIGGCVIGIMAAVCIFWPDMVYELTEGWKNSASGEPSHRYIVMCRIYGVLFALAAIFCVLVPFFDK